MGSYRGHCFLRVLFLLAAACFLPCSIALPRRGFPSSSNCHDTNPADDVSLTAPTPAVDARAVNRSELVVGNQITVPDVRSKIPARSFIPITTAGKFLLQTPDISPESELARHMRSEIPARPFMPTTMARKFWLQALDISPESELAGHMRNKMARNFWLQRDYLPSLLQTLKISPKSELAGHMHRTLSVCEDASRRKAGRCATSTATMAEFARSKAGASAVEMLQLSMATPDDPSMAMITGLKVKEGVLTCRALIFPFLVYLCENIHKTAIEVELESCNGERVTRVVQCDVDNTLNECTWLADESLVWVKNEDEEESEENSAIWMNEKRHKFYNFFPSYYFPPPPFPNGYNLGQNGYFPPQGQNGYFPPIPNGYNSNPHGVNVVTKINVNVPSSGTTSNANANPNSNPNSNTSNLNSNSNGLSGTNSNPSSNVLSNPDPLSSNSSTTSSSGDQSSDLNTPISKSNSSKGSLSSSSDSPSTDDTSTSTPSSSSSSTSSSSDEDPKGSISGKRLSSTSSKGSGL